MSVGFAFEGPNPGRFIRGIDSRMMEPRAEGDVSGSLEWDLEPLSELSEWYAEVVGTTAAVRTELGTWKIEWADDPTRELEAALFGPWDWATAEALREYESGRSKYERRLREAVSASVSTRRPFSIRTSHGARVVQSELSKSSRAGSPDKWAHECGWGLRVLAAKQQFILTDDEEAQGGRERKPDLQREASPYLSMTARLRRPWRTLPDLQAALHPQPARIWLVPLDRPISNVALASQPWASVLP